MTVKFTRCLLRWSEIVLSGSARRVLSPEWVNQVITPLMVSKLDQSENN
jgi:hypothetical protein